MHTSSYLYKSFSIMADTLASLCKIGKLRSSYLPIMVVKKIDDNLFIIADKSMVAMLDTRSNPTHGKSLNEGNWFKLIKCTLDEKGSVVTNKSFKPVRCTTNQRIGDISSKVNELENKMKSEISGNNQDFDAI